MTWDMNTFNVSATLNIFRVLARPSLCLPQATISTFNDLPIPLNKAFLKYNNVDIKAVVLDKDDCFAVPHENEVHQPYKVGILSLDQLYQCFFLLKGGFVVAMVCGHCAHLLSLTGAALTPLSIIHQLINISFSKARLLFVFHHLSPPFSYL
jgi:hypothetical protein